MIEIITGNCMDVLSTIDLSNAIIVTDPPFNIGYHYDKYNDSLPTDIYIYMLKQIFEMAPSVVVHYPEDLFKIAIAMNKAPDRVVTWCYNSNTPRQHRDVAFFGVKPDFSQVRQPYKNPNDKRIKERMARGCTGSKLYDWWNINQVKNVSKVKTKHPCQMPLEVMTNIIGILPKEKVIVDPFCGSGTTGVACKKLNRNFIGIEIDEGYAKLAKNRIDEYDGVLA